LKTGQIIFTAIVVSILVGCQPKGEKRKPLTKDKILFTVDFQKDQTLRYKFTSSRDIDIDWDPTKSASRPGQNTLSKSSQSMEMIIAYTPVKINPYGLSTINARCESVRASTGKGRYKDAVETLAGKTFTLTISPTGKIEDYSQLKKIILEAGEKAFRTSSPRGRIKEPDMIDDFIASQWFLWDSVSSLEKPVEGVSVGQSWKSQLSIPTSMVIHQARDVTYTLDEVRQTEKGRLAVIRSSYQPAESINREWPIPYSGAFQMSGTFGFLRGYRILQLKGQGKELFNLDAGRTETYNQYYEMKLQASVPMGISAKPQITIKQKLTMQLIE